MRKLLAEIGFADEMGRPRRYSVRIARGATGPRVDLLRNGRRVERFSPAMARALGTMLVSRASMAESGEGGE